MSVSKARQLRKQMSPTEIRLWRVLRLRPAGLRFRKQHPFGPYVFDFFCKSAGMAIEVDGLAHDFEQTAKCDERRDQHVHQQGIDTLRIAADDVRNNLEGVITHIVKSCLERTPPPHSVRSPSPPSDGEDVQS